MQLSHFDSLDSQAGIVLGFAGALVALTPGNARGLATAGRWLAIASGFLALWTFWPRRYWSIDLRPFRDKYLSAEPSFTAIRLLDTQIDMIERMGLTLSSKAVRLKTSMLTLASAVLLVGIGLGLD